MAFLDTPVPTVFISYSHAPKDEAWKDRLVEHLGVLAAEQGFAVWHDRSIGTGDDWNAEIERALDTACVAVLLISSAFLTSSFIRGHEVPHLLRRREQGKLTLVPVVVRACAWDELAWLKRLEMPLKITRPWEQFADQDIDSHLTAIAKEVAKLVREATREREPPPAPPARAPEPAPAPSPTPLELVARAAEGGDELRPDARSQSAQPTMSMAPSPVVVATASVAAPAPMLVAPPGVTLTPVSFQTVRVDGRGAIVERRQAETHMFEEDLGGGVTLEMVAIPGGAFRMGSPADEVGRFDNEGPQVAVAVAPFFMGKFVVTQGQWRVVATALPRVERDLAPAPSSFKGADRPVESVSWHEALEFCKRLSKQTGRTYRLPSEAEWEYAARAGTQTPFAFGPTLTPELVNYSDSMLQAVGKEIWLLSKFRGGSGVTG